jgi:predicted AAA+ superfamily ATPase
LRRQVGSAVSYDRLAKIANISPTTARKYVEILEALFIIFLVRPHSTKIQRAITKEAKVYFYDTGLVDAEDGVKFENLVAVSLLKHVWSKNDLLGERNSLSYIRTKEGKEVDFILIDKQNKPNELIEAKLSDNNVSKNLRYFKEKYGVPKATQIVKNLRNNKSIDGIEIISAKDYLDTLYM